MELRLRLRLDAEIVDYIKFGGGGAYISSICTGSKCRGMDTEHELIGEDRRPLSTSSNLSVKANWCPRFNDIDVGIRVGDAWDYNSVMAKMLTHMVCGRISTKTLSLFRDLLQQVQQIDVEVLKGTVRGGEDKKLDVDKASGELID